ncbi:MAG: DUF2924 domain-containing protein [Alphaproteobacteria bacterium]
MQQSREDALNAELARLPDLSHAELKARWLELYGKPLKGVRRDLLIRGIAYRLQEQVYGGLPDAIRRRIRLLRDAFARNPEYRPADKPSLKPGTRLIREWRGEIHEVSVLEAGFSYREKAFDNLSEIARTITGTRWSGPLFFGIKKLRPKAAVTKGERLQRLTGKSRRGSEDKGQGPRRQKLRSGGPAHGL